MNQTARSLAIANENRSIDASVARATGAAAKPRTALEAMAQRLEVSPEELKNTLVKTVFSLCRSESEFIALLLVSNEYGLNPLTKEIYAFPAKGGGVVPMVSVDGWNRIMNDHPAFDGIEFDYHLDAKGDVEAIESIIYRKDRSRPTKIMEYMVECKRETDPWKKSPRRMLRHRALMQGARVAFGFGGIAVEGDEDAIEGGILQSVTLPSAQSLNEVLDDEIPTFDKETGEVFVTDPQTGMSEVDEETARALDVGEGRATQDMGEGHTETQTYTSAQTVADIDGPLELEHDDKPAWFGKVQWLREAIAGAKNKQYLRDADFEFNKVRAGLPDEVIAEIEGLLNARRAELTRTASPDA